MHCAVTAYNTILPTREELFGNWFAHIILLHDVSSSGTRDRLTVAKAVLMALFHLHSPCLSVITVHLSLADRGKFVWLGL